MASARTQIQAVPRVRDSGEDSMQESAQGWRQWFTPRQENQMVAAQQTKGLFLPYPLLGILTTVGALVLSGIVGLYVQVNSLSTTLLLRDADHGRQISELKQEMITLREKNELLAMYINDDREKLAVIKARLGLK